MLIYINEHLGCLVPPAAHQSYFLTLEYAKCNNMEQRHEWKEHHAELLSLVILILYWMLDICAATLATCHLLCPFSLFAIKYTKRINL